MMLYWVLQFLLAFLVINPMIIMVVLWFNAPRTTGVSMTGVAIATAMTLGLMGPLWLEHYHGTAVMNDWLPWFTILQVMILATVAYMIGRIGRRWMLDDEEKGPSDPTKNDPP